MDEDIRQQLEDLVSPSDMKLIELAAGLTDDLKSVCEIFRDRNSKEVTEAFVLGLSMSLTMALTGVRIDSKDFIIFLQEQIEKQE